MTSRIKTSKPGYLTGNDIIDNEVRLTRIIDQYNNVYSGEKNIVPGDLYVSVNVSEINQCTPTFRVFKIVGEFENEFIMESISPAEVAAQDKMANAKLYSIIEEAKFLYKKYTKR